MIFVQWVTIDMPAVGVIDEASLGAQPHGSNLSGLLGAINTDELGIIPFLAGTNVMKNENIIHAIVMRAL